MILIIRWMTMDHTLAYITSLWHIQCKGKMVTIIIARRMNDWMNEECCCHRRGYGLYPSLQGSIKSLAFHSNHYVKPVTLLYFYSDSSVPSINSGTITDSGNQLITMNQGVLLLAWTTMAWWFMQGVYICWNSLMNLIIIINQWSHWWW